MSTIWPEVLMMEVSGMSVVGYTLDGVYFGWGIPWIGYTLGLPWIDGVKV